MADNRKRAPRGGKQAASGSRPIRRNDRTAAPKGQRDRTQAARPQRDRNRDAVQAPKGEFIEGRRAAAEALRTGFPIKCALIAEGGERDAALSRLVDDLNAAGVRIKYVPRAQLDALSSHGAHQGIALEVGNNSFINGSISYRKSKFYPHNLGIYYSHSIVAGGLDVMS